MLDRAGGRSTYGLTLGMADLLHSREIVLLVSGAAKRDAIHRLLEGAIATEFPASMLELHARVSLLCDAAAMSVGQPG
jgi:glucosamine-6-phosphate deaminase